uniref:Cyclic nucleotide-binding domain-containing protein n=1 Tax=Phytophthora ramorum TaxID=164328 RepID=H3HE79_PHYRM
MPVASLGPKSTIGDISLMLGIPEPTTVRAVTTVNVLSLSQEDFVRESSDRHDPAIATCIEKLQSTAYDTLRFVLERVEIESKNEHCDQRLKIDSLREALRQKHPGMTRQQRKAARAFASLQFPVADLQATPQTEDLLFLFPTMTQRRQLHGKNLPLLPRYRGFDAVPTE